MLSQRSHYALRAMLILAAHGDRPPMRTAEIARAANISAKLLRELGGDAVIGPMLVGMKQPVQIAAMSASASDLVTLAVLGAGRIVR